MNNWDNFLKEYSTDIRPIYEKHEKTFDPHGIHGTLHISRSLIFSEFMARFCLNELKIKDIHFNSIRYAVAFHDSGRQRNGKDLWENDSIDICYKYVLKHDIDAHYTANLISHNNSIDINSQIVHDSDVLEIMRPKCGHGGIYGFKSQFLNFIKDDSKYTNLRTDLINDAWELINFTENNKNIFSDEYQLNNILEFINLSNFKVLNIS